MLHNLKYNRGLIEKIKKKKEVNYNCLYNQVSFLRLFKI